MANNRYSKQARPKSNAGGTKKGKRSSIKKANRRGK